MRRRNRSRETPMGQPIRESLGLRRSRDADFSFLIQRALSPNAGSSRFPGDLHLLEGKSAARQIARFLQLDENGPCLGYTLGLLRPFASGVTHDLPRPS